MFAVEIVNDQRWFSICNVADLDVATEICKRAAISEKVAAQVVGDREVVFEAFYNQADDPDHHERDDWRDQFREKDVNLRWQEVGF